MQIKTAYQLERIAELWTLSCHNLPTDRARELLKRSRKSHRFG